MNALVNDYAISPSLHDWEREREDREDMKREAEEYEFESHFGWWHLNLYCDKERKNDRKTILESMSEAMNNLYNDAGDCERFEFALFLWYCSHDNREARDTIFELLDKHIRNVARKEWDRERKGSRQ